VSLIGTPSTVGIGKVAKDVFMSTFGYHVVSVRCFHSFTLSLSGWLIQILGFVHLASEGLRLTLSRKVVQP
jgi:hypothetical protein